MLYVYSIKMSGYVYRAGILTGNDGFGTFTPDSNILRSEVAAIVTRMTERSARKTISI